MQPLFTSHPYSSRPAARALLGGPLALTHARARARAAPTTASPWAASAPRRASRGTAPARARDGVGKEREGTVGEGAGQGDGWVGGPREDVSCARARANRRGGRRSPAPGARPRALWRRRPPRARRHAALCFLSRPRAPATSLAIGAERPVKRGCAKLRVETSKHCKFMIPACTGFIYLLYGALSLARARCDDRGKQTKKRVRAMHFDVLYRIVFFYTYSTVVPTIQGK